ncbi:MAG: hypothetical protein HDS81_00710 [Bacteroidales bacterium]|nr:hypothetical protein [Bacteroidales bacterium]MBD5252707.1 hypothetical protein [Barnesiella sp.]
MKHLIYIVISFIFCVLPFGSKAETNNDVIKEELSLQIDSLTHQIDYIKMSYEAYVLNTDLKIFTHDVNSQIKDMKMNIYHRNCDRDLYRMYSNMYDSYQDNLESTKELIEAKQRLFIAMMIAKIWSEEERNLLFHSYDMTSGLYRQAELTLDMMKDILDVYRKAI